jgi:hypothetical protein
MKQFKIIHKSETEDFFSNAKKQGYSENDFDFIEEDKTDYNNGDIFKTVWNT